MSDIDLGRAQELVESRFDSVGAWTQGNRAFSFKIGFPVGELTERQKRSVYNMVTGFAGQLKRQTKGTVLRWRVKPEIKEALHFEPPVKLRELFFSVDATEE
jgi:hypothetical protein